MTSDVAKRDHDKRQINILKSQLSDAQGSVKNYKVITVTALIAALALAFISATS